MYVFIESFDLSRQGNDHSFFHSSTFFLLLPLEAFLGWRVAPSSRVVSLQTSISAIGSALNTMTFGYDI